MTRCVHVRTRAARIESRMGNMHDTFGRACRRARRAASTPALHARPQPLASRPPAASRRSLLPHLLCITSTIGVSTTPALSDYHLADIRVHRPTRFGGPHQQGANAFSTAQAQPISAATAIKTPLLVGIFFDATGKWLESHSASLMRARATTPPPAGITSSPHFTASATTASVAIISTAQTRFPPPSRSAQLQPQPIKKTPPFGGVLF